MYGGKGGRAPLSDTQRRLRFVHDGRPSAERAHSLLPRPPHRPRRRVQQRSPHTTDGSVHRHLACTSFLDVSSARAGVARFVNTARNTELSNNTRLVVGHKRGEKGKQAWLVASRPIAADTELLLSYGSAFHVPTSASPQSPLFHHHQQQQQQQQSSSEVTGRLEAVSSLHKANQSLSPSPTCDAVSLVLCFADDIQWDDFPVEILDSRELLLAAPFQLVRDNVILSVLRYPQSRSRGT